MSFNGLSIILILGFLHSAIARANSFDYETLVDIVRTQGVTSIESLLPLLPEEFRSHYTLMHESRSRQEASWESPRAILFGRDASLTCAFNGDPGQRGSDSLECIQFRTDRRIFDFREILFPSPKNGLKAPQFSISGRSADGRIACSACHGAELRPNWDSYSNWPGAYGEKDDFIKDEEDAHYAAFRALSGTHPRYRWLEHDAEPHAPYDGRRDVFDYRRRPNLYFSELVGRMMGLRNARLLEERLTDWRRLAYAVGALKCRLTPAQLGQLDRKGERISKTAAYETYAQATGLSESDWNTQIFDDPEKRDDDADVARPYDHQYGYGFSAYTVPAVLAMDLAVTGNAALDKAYRMMMGSIEDDFHRSGIDDFRIIYGIAPDPGLYEGSFDANVNAMCDEFTRLLVASPPSALQKVGAHGTCSHAERW